MATKEILITEPLRGLSWSGNDKKTANVPAGYQFTFNTNFLPDFSEIYSKPEQFKIIYKDANGTDREVTCNYVSNGLTRYTFSYKIDNDVINLSVFKSDGHLEINVRNEKLEYPMDLNSVEFTINSEFGVSYAVNGPGRVEGKDTVLAGYELPVKVFPNEGCRLSTIRMSDIEEDFEVTKVSDTLYRGSIPNEILGLTVYVNVNFEEIPPVTEYTLRVVNGEPAEITTAPGTNVDIYAHPAPEGKQFDKWVVSGTEEEVVANIYARETIVNVLVDGIVVTATYKDIPEPPVPTEGDLIFTTTFNKYAIVDVLVKEDGSAGIVNVRRMTETDVDLDDTYETVLRAACTFRQDLIVGVEVIMNKPDNVAANYTVNSTRILINGEEL